MFRNGEVDSLWDWTLPKYALYPKMLKIKLIELWILYKKVSGRICQSPPATPHPHKLGVPKIAIFWNIITFKNVEVYSLWGWMLPKICIISKNASNKSCWALNCVRKRPRTHMSISPQSGARRFKDYHLLKYNVQKWEVDSLCGWTLPKICIVSKNASNKSCWALNSVQKRQRAHMSISIKSGARGLQRLPSF